MSKSRQCIQVIGEVIITTIHGVNKTTRKFRNSITNLMASNIVDFLAGIVNTNNIPRYIAAGVGSTSEANFSTSDFNRNPRGLVEEYTNSAGANNRYIITSRVPSISSEYAKVEYKAFIAPDGMRDGTEITELGLFSTNGLSDNDTNNNTMLARVRFNEGTPLIKTAGTAIDISWNIIILPSNNDITTINN